MRTLIALTLVGLLLLATVDAAKPKKTKDVKVKQATAQIDDTNNAEDPTAADGTPAELPKIVRPRNLRVLTAYDRCKQECKRQREQEGLVSYVEQLKAELASAEAAIAEQEAADAASAEAIAQQQKDQQA